MAALAALAIAVAAGAAGSSSGTLNLRDEIPPNDLEVDQNIPNSQSNAHVPSAHVPRPAGTAIATSNPGFTGFAGLNHRDQRLSDGGNQFSLEPPDQALCVGGGEVVEAVNDVIATYSPSGTKTSPSGSGATSLTVFLTGEHQVIRDANGAITHFGPFITDPKCYFDPALNRFFLTVEELGQDPVTGNFNGESHLIIAVSTGSTPTTDPADWNIFTIQTENDGTNGMPSHPGCPCFGDQPLIGADANAFVITTNEFSLEPFGAVFNGAQIYAIDKAGLAAGTLKFQLIDGHPIPLEEGPAFTIQPSTAPTAAEWSSANGGTEFMASDLDFDATLDNRLAVWALTNTSSLAGTATPNVHLSHVVISSEVYGQPPDAEQKPGPTPLADAIPALLGKPGNGPREHLELIAGNDDRMEQVVLANGKLWTGVNTVVKQHDDITRVGIAWFVITPSFPNGGTLSATVSKQGYLAVDGQNVMYPSLGVNSTGHGVMGFTLVGPDFFPSTAYAPVDASSGTGLVHIAGAGVAPEDGFTGYHPFGGNGTARWGDYSAAVADASGNIWVGNEYIPGPRTTLANWGTFISHVTP